MHNRGGIFTFFLIIAAISLVFDWYVFSGLKTLTADWQSARMRRLIVWGYLIIAVGITLLFVIGLNSFNSAKGMTPYHEYTLSFFITFLITKIF